MKSDFDALNSPLESSRLEWTETPRPTQRPRTQSLTSLSLVLLGVGAGIAGMSILPQLQRPQPSPPTVTSPVPPTALPAPVSAKQGTIATPDLVASVVQHFGPAVVRINATKTVENQMPQQFNDPSFERFFGSQMPNAPKQEIVRGSGSGFIVNSNGRIITNAHVVDGATKVSVVLKDGRQFEGKVVGTDPVTDVAVIEIQADNLPTLTIGNSETLQPGELAIAIGNPLGLDNTVTVGIISATGRSGSEVGIPDKRVSFIQTDAAINPGNSGGPLLNQKGEVIGMNTAIIQGAQGLGFAIPINQVQRIADQISTTGKVEHPYLGIQMVTLSPEVKESLNQDPNSPISVNEDQGVLIARVMPNSPAHQSGLRAGDVIIQVDNIAVTKADEIQQIVENVTVGSQLKMQIKRQGQPLNLDVKTGAIPINQ
ncbi:HhoA/HhoB/HtrA family serine endopeptidase [Planktothrix agardhii]|jgi:Do/DeqQ family serine protease|uniref:Serine protease HtrA n=1 Tax=Planktothrix agardhii TaxID=1160 RepID=A0A1J1JEK1_PLAAG|nr:HhoA/HhoB/HtrA family serine endopeptidase [Planktothrix agardhii]BBD53842.1 HtrA2 peptidase [Planktothrix agardhii NIES-204]MCB8758202.1 trypsin-like peptidase domain-containing protein [Planktothrix agardhii 1813]MCB8766068.1 trypsin-like peptidase domain-containing protein [Planktothrix agardhii 1809]MCB8777855.1 trypsin-like peptidase domain-containing protein [Planktothrix agardhii 1031]MCB8779703.1 trypsin-like peptidase domain-containing protein [Planktothrix agardhii 1031]